MIYKRVKNLQTVVKWRFCIATLVYLRVRAQWDCFFLMPKITSWIVDKCCLDTHTLSHTQFGDVRQIGILIFPTRPQKNHPRSTGMRLMYARAFVCKGFVQDTSKYLEGNIIHLEHLRTVSPGVIKCWCLFVPGSLTFHFVIAPPQSDVFHTMKETGVARLHRKENL